MPRRGRIHLPGGIYHVIIRGIERKKIFRIPADRAEFVRRLAQKICRQMGIKRLEIAKYLGISDPGVSKMVRRGYLEREKIELSYQFTSVPQLTRA